MDGSRRTRTQSSGEAVRSANACWNSTSIRGVRDDVAAGRQFVHAGQFGHERRGPEALVITFLKFEGDRPQPAKTRNVVEGIAPYFGGRRAGMAVHIEPGELVAAGEVDLLDRVRIELSEIGLGRHAAVSPGDVKIVQVEQGSAIAFG